jgi:hypothetical protein
MIRRVWVGAVVCAFAALFAVPSAGANSLVPLGEPADPIAFDQPIFVTSDPADPDRLFVVERTGRVQEVLDGEVAVYADLTSWVECCAGERGLLSIALAPDFDLTGRFYAAYTGKAAAGGATGDLHVDLLTPTGDSGGEVDRKPIITIEHSTNNNHNGGQLNFGPDGYLYISTGDGGGGGDPFESGQDLDTLLGKILRIEPHPDAAGAEPAYTSPAGNPFVGADGRDEIWAYGLRNPWRFSFDRLSGDMVIGDVGQGAREEIDYAPAPLRGRGADYGWNCREGLIAYSSPGDSCQGLSYPASFTDPVLDYPHQRESDDLPSRCSITGGYVVRDPGLGDLYGRYLYADFCGGQIHSLELASGASSDRNEGLNPLPNAAPNPNSFGEDSCGRIYLASGNGKVFQLVGDGGPGCTDPPIEEPPKEEPPKEEPPEEGKQPVGRAQPISYSVDLRAKRRGNRVAFQISAAPCGALDGFGLQLNRGGRRVSLKPIAVDCTTRFNIREPGRASFRAILLRGDEALLRSDPLKVLAARRR